MTIPTGRRTIACSWPDPQKKNQRKERKRRPPVGTRSYTPSSHPSSCEELTEIALKLRERVDLGPRQRYRLVSVGLSNFRDSEDTAAQPDVFQVQD